MFVWMSGFQNLLEHTDFNMFVDDWTSANESPALLCLFKNHRLTIEKVYIYISLKQLGHFKGN